MRQPGFVRGRRVLRLVRVLLRHGLRLLWSRLRPGPSTERGPVRLRRLLEDLGGTYIKFGQVLSLQPDALPVEYCNALFDLLDKVPPFPYANVESTFLEDLGRGPGEIFDTFDPTPIASASIGQVHVAFLADRKLAVKVRRPTVESDFAADVATMRTAATLLDFFRLRRWKWLVRATREFCSWTHEELDYRYEARFMASLGHNARDNPRETVPALLDAYTTSRILVADFIEGPMVLDYIRSLEAGDDRLGRDLALQGFDGEAFARNIVRNFVNDAFHHGLFHADLHPANLLILPDNVVGYVDFGITGSLSAYSRRNMVSLTLTLTRADVDGMVTCFLKIASVEDDSDVEAFRDGLETLVDEWFDRSGGDLRFRSTFSIVMLDMLRLSRQTNLWPTPDVIRYIRSVITADGLITRFAPDMDVGGYLETVCTRYLERRVWKEWLSIENIADLTSEGILLLNRGPETVERLLARRGRTDGGAQQENPGTGDGRISRHGALRAALVAFGAGTVAWASRGPAEWGANPFTVGVAVAGTAAVVFITLFRRRH